MFSRLSRGNRMNMWERSLNTPRFCRRQHYWLSTGRLQQTTPCQPLHRLRPRVQPEQSATDLCAAVEVTANTSPTSLEISTAAPPITAAAPLAGTPSRKLQGTLSELEHQPSSAEDLFSAYRAAGVLFYNFNSRTGELYLLMAKADHRREGGTWTFLGGKREEFDASVADTAAREVEEESGGLLAQAFVKRGLARCSWAWIAGGQFVAYLIFLPNKWNLPQQHKALLLERENDPPESLELRWFPLRSLKHGQYRRAKFRRFVGRVMDVLLDSLVKIEDKSKAKFIKQSTSNTKLLDQATSAQKASSPTCNQEPVWGCFDEADTASNSGFHDDADTASDGKSDIVC